ncbi:hypothetical protein [Chlorogloeopsis fritschii]|nr:hypothetical protein [Chlorogloeopsis fritschii]
MKIIFRNAKTPAQTRYIASLQIKFIPRFSNAHELHPAVSDRS